jgi:preprotein translocase subunit SecE
MANFVARVPVFFQEVRTELTKVSWPSRKELMGATWIVILTTTILTLYVGVLDYLLSKGVMMVLK